MLELVLVLVLYNKQTDESSLATPRSMPMTFGLYKQELHFEVYLRSPSSLDNIYQNAESKENLEPTRPISTDSDEMVVHQRHTVWRVTMYAPGGGLGDLRLLPCCIWQRSSSVEG